MRNSGLIHCEQLTSWLVNPFRRAKARRAVLPVNAIEQFEDRLLLTQFSVLSNADSGADTLRQAILDANDNEGPDTIVFTLGSDSLVISPLTPLPAITDTVTIDGSSQTDFAGVPLVVISGASLPDDTFAPGLEIDSVNSMIKSLVIQSFVDGEGILIGGFDTTGVTGNHIEGCYIGTNSAGTAAAGNGNGVRISSGAQNNVIGGTQAGQGNVISGNGTYGVLIQGVGTSGNLIQGNALGTSADRTAAVGNGYGVALGQGPSNNTIGGLTAGASNLISGNVDYGIALFNDVTGTQILGNLIGTNATGTASLGNHTDVAGISLSDGTNGNTIGGTTAAARNVIAGISGTGIRLRDAATSNNIIQGNYVGVDVTGTTKISVGDDDIFIEGAANNSIGGTAAGAGNVISGADRHGLVIFGEDSTGNIVQGNLIGTNAAGTAAIPNSADGIRIDGASDNTIGGTAAGAGNVISGNLQNGITVTTTGATDNVIQGNRIGVQSNGTSALGNGIEGIDVNFSASSNLIGGRSTGAGNIIAFNTGRGVVISGATAEGNTVVGNSIHSNGDFAIDLNADLATANDALDADNGPNGLQNFPVLSSVTVNDGVLTIQGSINSSSLTEVTLDFYSSVTNDANGFGQGQTYLGSLVVTTGNLGGTSFTAVLNVNVPEDQLVTATATTNVTEDTSEFSASMAVIDTTTPNPILNLVVQNVNYTPQQPPVVLAPAATLTDADSENFNGGSLMVSLSPKGKGKELLSIRSQGTGQGQISVVGATVQFGGTAIGTFTGGKGKKPLVVSLNANATVAAVQELVRNITFVNTAKKSKVSQKSIQFQLTDEGGHSSGTLSLVLTYVQGT